MAEVEVRFQVEVDDDMDPIEVRKMIKAIKDSLLASPDFELLRLQVNGEEEELDDE